MKQSLTAALILAIAVPAAASAAPLAYVTDSVGNLATVDVVTGAATLLGNSGVVLTDIAFDNSGTLYGIDFGTLYRVDKTSGAVTTVGATGASVNALTFGNNGSLYAAGGSGLYTLSTTTGQATSLGNTGFNSSGDLTFLDGTLYLSATGNGDSLVSLAVPGATGTLVGSLGLNAVYGLSRATNNVIYANSNNAIYTVDAATGATTFATSYTYAGAGIAYGTSFLNEATVPEPATWALMMGGFGFAGSALRRRRAVSAVTA